MPISTNLQANLRKTLLCCDELSDFQLLRATFVNKSIHAWQDRLRKANSASDQVNLLIDQLGQAYNSADENALALFLQVLADTYDQGDKLFHDLKRLAEQVRQETGQPCANCEALLEPSRTFCLVCGMPTQIDTMDCPTCRQAVPVGSQFCLYCAGAL